MTLRLPGLPLKGGGVPLYLFNEELQSYTIADEIASFATYRAGVKRIIELRYSSIT